MNTILNVRSPRFAKLDDSTPANGKGHFDGETSTATATEKTTLFLGFDWGTNKSCLKAAYSGQPGLAFDEIVPTIVGYAKDGIVEGLLPGNANVLYGQKALQHRLHLNLVQPMVDGVVKELPVARDFARHLRSLIGTPTGTEIRAVIGVPANADSAARENVRQCVAGLFDRVLLVPEPFLAALGFRDESKLDDSTYVDPVRNSLFVDIGGGTTDVCMVQGFYPTADDQISLAYAGDKVDGIFYEGIRKTYPDCELSPIKIRELKEQFSYVGKAPGPIIATVMVNGKSRKLDLTEQLGNACGEMLSVILATVKELISRASSDSVGELLQNIILTGGGSRIRGIDVELQRLLAEEGYEQPCVRLAGDRFREFVALGALKAARQARENQWQQVIK
jgi:rod shape-determining protein MreB